MGFENDVIFVTGGAGFIGSAVIRHLLAETEASVVNLDKLTYAANLESVFRDKPAMRYHFAQVDICDGSSLRALFERYEPQFVMNLAAETHVDRSIECPDLFIQTNVVGTFTLLQEALRFWHRLGRDAQKRFRFHHVSTDEVYGSLTKEGMFSESTPYAPNSPYSASKAAADHLVRAWQKTYGLPTIISSSSNNYGPFQFPEKLIPHMIIKGLADQPLPVYGDGQNVRDWLYVEDHARALADVLRHAAPGETYNIGSRSERTNISIVNSICRLLDELQPSSLGPRHRLITFVSDRPAHDRRYGIDPSKIQRELAWKPTQDFESGLAKTVKWYVDNRPWWQNILNSGYDARRIGVLQGLP
jgi:dTDP-glucose 4,6-dehydratase